ncbi:hypothetical protein GQ55_8G100400 [Panicum hallii var. hallii]|uniref:Receptor kinase-like protein Xa21 n=1 Tax=Panicum hallii var. hallii TaxID=1504633 RepID=A0A2T7CM99_9POAL|nr:hypothetical protein GQ55_8G100400 [Panicum hallii var. hallii]
MPHVATRKLSISLLLVPILIHFLSKGRHVDSLAEPTPVLPNESEEHALLCLRSQLSDPSGALASWRNNTSRKFCEWYGVTCSARHASRVIALDLESLNISGQIFPCIADLNFLTRIHMPNNQLNGHISPEIGRLTRLRYLNLSMNSLSGELPETMSSCSRLQIVDLVSNSLEGEIPPSLAQCSALQKIILGNNNFYGNIPSQFGLLPNLTALFIPGNKLTGIIPTLLGSSKSLKWVNLQNNSLTGRIPPDMFNSTSLIYIDLSHNELSGSIPPFSQTFSPLQYLSLTTNNLSGEIPTSIGNLSSLNVLQMAQNNLEGSIPESLGRIGSLQEIDLTYNDLSGLVPSAIYTITSLSYLGIGANQFVGRIPIDIGYTLPRLTHLILEGNRFEGSIPISLANVSSLEVLDLRSNAFTGLIPSFGPLRNLINLDLGANRLESGDWTFLSSLTNCTKLEKLCLDRNNLQGIIPTSVANLSKSLEKLILIENQLTGGIPSGIGELTSLTALQMDKNLISGHIPDSLRNLQNLSILSLSRNKLSGEIPLSLGKLEQLTNLYLEENSLIGHIPASLASCKNLLRLNLSCNDFSGSIPKELFSITTLSEGLDLSHNHLTGCIPMEVGRLINLNSLSMSNNQLSGQIPSTLGECVLLDSLHLEENFLNGSIPRSFTRLRGINKMDLSQNNLSGQIPEFFRSFSSLQILNLSFNDLEGPVPQGGVFANSSAMFIKGNKKLCANSPMLQVPLCIASAPKRKKTSYIPAVVFPLTAMAVVAMACLAVTILKKEKEAKQPNNQSFKQFKIFSYDDIFQATDGFSSANLVGSGRFGLVYRGQFDFEENPVAIKVLKLDQFGASNNFRAECEALRYIRHRNLIRVISLCSTFDTTRNEFKALILEYMANGNLENWIRPKGYEQSTKEPLSLRSRITVAVDIASALDYLHNRCTPPVVHCDLKPSNVLLDDQMVACLSDFGLAKFLSCDSSEGLNDLSRNAGPKGSVGYIAPEYGMGCKLSCEGDVYSYGIILLQMVTGKNPTDDLFKDGLDLHNFVESSIPHNIGEIVEPSLTKYHKSEEAEQAMVGMQTCVLQLAKLGVKCSKISPKDRPTMEDVYAEITAIKEELFALYNYGSR